MHNTVRMRAASRVVNNGAGKKAGLARHVGKLFKSFKMGFNLSSNYGKSNNKLVFTTAQKTKKQISNHSWGKLRWS